MINVAFGRIEDYNDVETCNRYRGFLSDGLNEKEALELIHIGSRDHAITLMQWSDAPQAGFSTGTPWLGVNPSYKTIHVAADLAEPEGIDHFYQRLIALKQEEPTLIHGRFELAPSVRRLLLPAVCKKTASSSACRISKKRPPPPPSREIERDFRCSSKTWTWIYITLPPFAALWLKRN